MTLIHDDIAAIEQTRNSRALVLSSTHLGLDLVAPLYDTLRVLGRQPKLDVILITNGGTINAAYRIAILLQDFTDELSFIVPDICKSAGVVLCLAGTQIVAGATSIFSPIDPSLHSHEMDGALPTAFSSEDVRLFPEVIREWFGVDPDLAHDQALNILCDNIFPATLSTFYRSVAECRHVCHSLVSQRLKDASDALISSVYEPLLYPRLPHSFALTGGDLKTYGLPIIRDPKIESFAWNIANALRHRVGGQALSEASEGRVDTILATSDLTKICLRSNEHPKGEWLETDTEEYAQSV